MNKIKKISINDIDILPDNPIYMIEELNQYAIKINGILYRGNIGNIYNKLSIIDSKNHKSNDCKSDEKKINQTIICKHGNKCYCLLHKPNICNFYHDILDVYNLYKKSVISLEKYNLYKTTTKNFINTSWLYTKTHNKNTRHFGSNENLLSKIKILEP